MLLYLLSNKWNNENIFHFTSLEYFLSFKKAEIWAALLFFCKSSIRNTRAIFISCCFYPVGDQSWLVYFHRHKIIKYNSLWWQILRNKLPFNKSISLSFICARIQKKESVFLFIFGWGRFFSHSDGKGFYMFQFIWTDIRQKGVQGNVLMKNSRPWKLWK